MLAIFYFKGPSFGEYALYLAILTFLLLNACAPQPPLTSPGHLNLPAVHSPPKNDIPPPVQQSTYIPPPPPLQPIQTYSVVISEVPVNQLLIALAKDAGMNVDVYPGIEGIVSLNVIDQTLPQILDRIAKQVNLRYQIEGSNLLISPDLPVMRLYKVNYVNMQRDSKSDVKTSTQVASAGTVAVGAGGSQSSGMGNNSTTEIINTSNNQFWQTLKENIEIILSGNKASQRTSTMVAQVTLNPESGIISVRATEKQHEEIQYFLAQVMASVQRQVLIEATVVEVRLNDRYQAGVDWQRIAGDYSYTQSLLGENLGNTPFYSIGYTNPDSKFGNLSATVRLLEQFGNVKVLSSPKIMALNNQTAVLKVVDNIVYFTTDVEISETETRTRETFETKINTVPVGLVMNITPQISDDGIVILNIRPTISRIIGFKADPDPRLTLENLIPEIQVREIESVLKINNGDIAVIGGLMEDTTNHNRTGIPGLSKLPMVGDLFSYRDDQYTKTELVIFLRPVVIKHASLEGDLKSYRVYLPDPTQPDTLPPTGLSQP